MRGQQSYKNYSEEQFAADEYFQQWVLNNDVDTELFWSEWLQENQSQAEVMLNARKLVLELAAKDYHEQPLSVEEKSILKQDIFTRLNLQDHLNKPVNKVRHIQWKHWAAAAAILVVAFTSFYFFNKHAITEDMLFVQAGNNETREIQLVDSSVVILNAGSSLQYSTQFEEKAVREVFLKGNAFFKVKKEVSKKQFIVHAGILNVAVLGTKFNVNARSAATEVVLTSGSVKLGIDKKAGTEVLMQPGDKVVFDSLNGTLKKIKTDTQLYSAWTDGKWNFRQTSLEDIMELVKTYYGVDIIFKNEKAKLLKMSAVIPVNSLQMLLPVVAKTLRVNISQANNQLIIQ